MGEIGFDINMMSAVDLLPDPENGSINPAAIAAGNQLGGIGGCQHPRRPAASRPPGVYGAANAVAPPEPGHRQDRA